MSRHRLTHGGRLLSMALWLLGCDTRASVARDAGDATAVPPGRRIGEPGGPCGYGPPCDPRNLAGLHCEDFVRPGGVLSCDPETCRFDVSGCASLSGPPSDAGGTPDAAETDGGR